ncbi:MAG: hypothetical protein WC763_03930 [Candidatus Paceibacterota bacterium]|jgi:hypothetical protein
MLWNKYFLPFFALLCLVAILHSVAEVESYYWTVWWYDIMMHFLGGAWVALAILWASEMPFAGFIKSRLSIRSIVLSVIVVGVVWEIYELAFGLTSVHTIGYALDTAHDLVMDTAGAGVVSLVWKRFIKSPTK